MALVINSLDNQSIPSFVFETEAEPSNIKSCTPMKKRRPSNIGLTCGSASASGVHSNGMSGSRSGGKSKGNDRSRSRSGSSIGGGEGGGTPTSACTTPMKRLVGLGEGSTPVTVKSVLFRDEERAEDEG